MTAVLIFVLGYCAVSLVSAVAWVSLKAEKRRDKRIQAEREPEPLDLTSDLDVLLTREELRQETLAYALRQDVTL